MREVSFSFGCTTAAAVNKGSGQLFLLVRGKDISKVQLIVWYFVDECLRYHDPQARSNNALGLNELNSVHMIPTSILCRCIPQVCTGQDSISETKWFWGSLTKLSSAGLKTSFWLLSLTKEKKKPKHDVSLYSKAARISKMKPNWNWTENASFDAAAQHVYHKLETSF